MEEIYKGCSLNIAATASDSPEDGLFRERELDPDWPWFTYACFGAGDNRFCLAYDTRFFAEQIELILLNTRACVLQERLLSPRKIHFGQEQIFWECLERSACEMFLGQIPMRCFYRSPSFELSKVEEATNIPTSQQPYHLWDILVQKCTSREITVPSDKLVALSGLANKFSV